MLNKRLLRLIPGIYSSVGKSVLFQWLALICNITVTFVICRFLNNSYIYKSFDIDLVLKTIVIITLAIILRSFFTKKYMTLSAHTAQKAKKILKEKIFDRLCSIGISYKNYISTAEAVQVSVEGTDQLEIYFSQYIPQLFYSVLSVITLFIVFSFLSFKTALVFIVCVPLIPLSIVLVQGFAKKLLSPAPSLFYLIAITAPSLHL